MTLPPLSIASSPVAFTSGGQKRIAALAAGFGVVAPHQLQAVTDKVLALIADTAGAQQPADGAGPAPESPQLRKPDLVGVQQSAGQSGAGRLTPEAALGFFMSELSSLLATDNLDQLKSRLELVQARLRERTLASQEASDQLQQAYAALEGALTGGEVAAGELADLERALRSAQVEVARLQKEIAEAPPGEQDALRAKLKVAQAQLQQVAQQVESARQSAGQALAALAAAEAQLAAAQNVADELGAGPLLAPPDSRALTNEARLAELLAMLQEIVSKANDAKLSNEMQLVRELLKAREAANLRRSQEYQEQLEKAERTKKTMGCVGKIVGWVATVVAVVAAPFSGSASMALAAIGLTLAVASELGLKVVDQAIQKVMDLVMKAVKAVGRAIGSVLEMAGLSRKIIDKIQDALGAVTVAAVIIGALFASRKLAASIASREAVKLAVQKTSEAVARAASRMVGRSLPAVAKQAATKGGQQLALAESAKAAAVGGSQAAGGGAAAVARTTSNAAARNEMLARRAGQALMASHVIQFANQTSQGVASIVVADMQVKAAKLLAELELGMADTKILRDLIEKLLEYFVASNRMVQALFQQMADVQANAHDTARHITQRIARA